MAPAGCAERKFSPVVSCPILFNTACIIMNVHGRHSSNGFRISGGKGEKG